MNYLKNNERKKAGYIEGIVSMLINTLLFAFKLWAGIVTGSIALTADAWHTLSDSLSSIIVIISIKLSSRKPDREHPFGHGRWEHMAAIFIGFLLALIAYDFMKSSVVQFIDRESTDFGILAITVVIISIVSKEALAQYAFYVWRKTDNLAVKTDGWHHRTDALSSVIVLIGILCASQFWWMDSTLGFIIAIMIFYTAYGIIKESIHKLLGEQPDPELIAAIEKKIYKRYGRDFHPHHYHIHNYVAHRELTFHIRLEPNMSIASGHGIATEIEKLLFDLFGITATIRLEPYTLPKNPGKTGQV